MSNRKDLNYYKSLDYRVLVEPQQEDDEKWFIAYAEELGKYSCFGRGETPEEAMRDFYEQKDDFMEYLYKSGKKIPEPKEYVTPRYSGFFNVRTSPQIHAELVRQAKERNISLNLYLNQILSQAIVGNQYAFDLNNVMKELKEIKNKIDDHHHVMSGKFTFDENKLNKGKYLSAYKNVLKIA